MFGDKKIKKLGEDLILGLTTKSDVLRELARNHDGAVRQGLLIRAGCLTDFADVVREALLDKEDDEG